jgi:hypothetical protein
MDAWHRRSREKSSWDDLGRSWYQLESRNKCWEEAAYLREELRVVYLSDCDWPLSALTELTTWEEVTLASLEDFSSGFRRSDLNVLIFSWCPGSIHLIRKTSAYQVIFGPAVIPV